MTIETENLELIQCDFEILKEAIAGNKKLSTKLGIEVAEHWTEFGVGTLQYSLNRLSENKNRAGGLFPNS